MQSRERTPQAEPPTDLERAAFELLTDAVSADSGVIVSAADAPVVLTTAVLLMSIDSEVLTRG